MNNGKLRVPSYVMSAAHSALAQDSACCIRHRHLTSVDHIQDVNKTLMRADRDQPKTVSAA